MQPNKTNHTSNFNDTACTELQSHRHNVVSFVFRHSYVNAGLLTGITEEANTYTFKNNINNSTTNFNYILS